VVCKASRCCFIVVLKVVLSCSSMRKLNDDDLARGPEEVFTIVSKIGRG